MKGRVGYRPFDLVPWARLQHIEPAANGFHTLSGADSANTRGLNPQQILHTGRFPANCGEIVHVVPVDDTQKSGVAEKGSRCDVFLKGCGGRKLEVQKRSG